MRLARGEVIFHQGGPGDETFLVVHGRVRIGRAAESGKEHVLSLLGPGELFGELTLFDPVPRKATATAATDVELVSLSGDAVRAWLTDDPDAAWQLVRFLARRLRRTSDVLENLLVPDVPRRVARTLLTLADRFGRRVLGGVRVEHGLTQEELAHYVGASRESVNRTLAALTLRSVIRLEPRAIIITDLAQLRHKAGEPVQNSTTH